MAWRITCNQEDNSADRIILIENIQRLLLIRYEEAEDIIDKKGTVYTTSSYNRELSVRDLKQNWKTKHYVNTLTKEKKSLKEILNVNTFITDSNVRW